MVEKMFILQEYGRDRGGGGRESRGFTYYPRRGGQQRWGDDREHGYGGEGAYGGRDEYEGGGTYERGYRGGGGPQGRGYGYGTYGSAAFGGGTTDTSDRGSSFGGLEFEAGGGGLGSTFGAPLSSVVVPADTKEPTSPIAPASPMSTASPEGEGGVSKSEGELSVTPSLSPESVRMSPASTVRNEWSQSVESLPPHPVRRNLVGHGLLSKYWLESTGPTKAFSKMFYDSCIFGSNQKAHLTPHEITRFAQYRRQNSLATFEFALVPAMRVPVSTRIQMGEDVWAEYHVFNQPRNKGIFLEKPPPTLANPYRMRARPRILDATSYAPFSIVSAVGGGERIEGGYWICKDPSFSKKDIIRIPDDIHIPEEDVSDILQLLAATPRMDRTCNISFMGDSTIPGIIRPLEEFIKAASFHPGAPQYGHAYPVYGRGKTLYEIVNIDPLEPPDDSNFLILKFQNDFLNIFGAGAKNKKEKEAYLDKAIPEFVKEIEGVIDMAQTNMCGATIIVLGMNPLNTELVAPYMFDDPDAVNFVSRTDHCLRDCVSRKCDCHFISVGDIFFVNGSFLTPQTAVWGTHMELVANFFIAKEIRRLIFQSYAKRATLGLGNVDRFSMWEARKGLLTPRQEMYAMQVLGLVENAAGKARSGW